MLGKISNKLAQAIAHLEALKEEVDYEMSNQSSDQPDLINDILFSVAGKHGVAVEEILSDSKAFHICRARDEVAYKLKATGRSYASIGTLLGNRDHTTIMSSVRRHEQRM